MTVSNISLPWLSAALSDAPPAVWGLWGAVAVCYLLLFFVPSWFSVTYALWSVAAVCYLLFHFLPSWLASICVLWGAVAVCYLLLLFVPSLLASHGQKNAGTAVHTVLLAALLLLHVGGIYAMLMAEISLSWVLAALLSSAVVGISLGRLQEIFFSRPGEMPADASDTMTPTETETEAEAEANAPDGDGTEAEAAAPDGISGDVPSEAVSAAKDDGKAAHDTPAMPDTPDTAEEETASAAPDRTEKGDRDR